MVFALPTPLSSAPHLSALAELRMSRCGLGERGAAAAGRLLEHSRWGSRGTGAVRDTRTMPLSEGSTQRQLHLSTQALSDEHPPSRSIPPSFAASPVHTAVRVLDLS